MGSDRARISFDPTRGYRSVVAQQGRVTLEADVNEQASIDSEALRLETIDIIGPAGTPDQNGYAVSVGNLGAVTVAPGTMYVGGWRMTLPDAVPLANQPEWLDQQQISTIGTAQKGNSVVALLVTEQAISAIEDQALREVALGGPDTAARTRLMQHLVEIPVADSTCEGAEATLEKTLLSTMGLRLNPRTLELDFEANLEVSFFPPTTQQDPCCPPAQGGYLGADNQLVSVTVASFAAPSGTLLWGWNNASFLYRASVVNPQVLQLSPAPVDAAHSPQPGQVIEILRTTMVLGDAADDNYVAAPQGLIVTLGTGTIYDGTTQQLTLPPGTTLPTDPDTLFVRLWQAEVPFTSGQTEQLDTVSGLAVTVKIKALPTAPLMARPFWTFAVRPNTPQQVYPQRYLEAPQPPEGPRQWLCDLAIVGQNPNGIWSVIADCRKHFLPLTDLGECSCCNLVLDPSKDWLGTLNTAMADTTIEGLSICFMPGLFQVTSKITFTNLMVKITGAGDSTVIEGQSLEAVLEFDSCTSVNLCDICVASGTAGYTSSNSTVGLQGAVTIRSCNMVDIERVAFACADADLRAASCLAVYNPAPPANATETRPLYNIRVLNSYFVAGYNQVGILMVNADRAQIEGNYVYNKKNPLKVVYGDLSARTYIRSRLEKNLLHEFTITNTAAPTKKAEKRILKKQKKTTGTSVPTQAAKGVKKQQSAAPAAKSEPTPDAAPAASGAAPGTASATGAAPVSSEPVGSIPVQGKLPVINLGAVGRARITATYGTFKLQLVSSDKLTNAWTDALNTAGLNANSTEGELHTAVKSIVASVFTTPNKVANAFRNYVNLLLPQLYSTSAQGIVIAGNAATDIRILNNTIDGAVQGIHVGLSDRKLSPVVNHMATNQVQICGNTVNISLTPESTGDRHGIFLSSVTSALIDDNHLTLTRTANAGQDIYAIKVVGLFGPRLLIERNTMLNFSCGIYAQPVNEPSQTGNLWKAADNASTSTNFTASFRTTDNIP